MENSQGSEDQPKDISAENNQKDLKETLKEAKNDQSVKDALKKEKQPQTTDDLSNLHNNRQTGTTGGDQRASEAEIKQSIKPAQTTRLKEEKNPDNL